MTIMKRTVAAAIVSLATASSGLALSLEDTGTDNFGDLPDNFGVGSIDYSDDIWQALVGGGPIADHDDLLDRATNVIADRWSKDDEINDDPNKDQPFRSAKLDFTASVTLRYWGSEAGYSNTLLEVVNGDTATPIFANHSNVPVTASTPGDEFSFIFSPGGDNKLELAYCTDTNDNNIIDADGDGCVSNTGETRGNGGDNLEIAVSKIFDYKGEKTVLFFFGDGVKSNDSDLDDMVISLSVSAVPLPAGMLLFGSALAGLGVVSRRRRRT